MRRGALSAILIEGGMRRKHAERLEFLLDVESPQNTWSTEMAAAIFKLLAKRTAEARQGALAFFSHELESAEYRGAQELAKDLADRFVPVEKEPADPGGHDAPF